MIPKSDAKFKEILTCGFKYDLRNSVNFHPTTRKSENFTLMGSFCRGVTFTRCLLLVEIHSLLVTRCKITRYSLQKLIVAKNHSLLAGEVARCKKSLVTRCKIRSLLVQKLLVVKNHSLLVAEVARCKNSLVNRCKIRSLLVAEVESLFVTLWKRNSTTGAFLWIFAKL